jgi:hypothetical protein
MNLFWIVIVIFALAAAVVYGVVILGAIRSYQKQTKARVRERFVRDVEKRFLGEAQ